MTSQVVLVIIASQLQINPFGLFYESGSGSLRIFPLTIAPCQERALERRTREGQRKGPAPVLPQQQLLRQGTVAPWAGPAANAQLLQVQRGQQNWQLPSTSFAGFIG